ncbi:MAG: hypothetical protein JWN18_122 [Parcubacteria group bacterium]|nr:hypothetical protein [Parcubacteria group bacterium]
MTIDTLITIGYYVSSIGFLIATIVTFEAARKASQSGLKTVLNYLFIGTATFFVITVFQKMVAAGVYSISDESPDIWWHIMFYLAMFSFYFGFKALARLGSADTDATAVSASSGKTWGIITAVLLVLIFIVPNMADGLIQSYNASKLAELGAHHFLAFALAGVVGAYLFSAKLFLGQVGKAIANPMIIAIWALAAQHFWELLVESWKVIEVTGEVGEGVEKIFLTIAAVCITFAALRLKSLAKAA